VAELAKVTVVVPVRDDTERLRGCLRAIAAQDYLGRGGRIEVVVVDSASRPPLRRAALGAPEALGVRLLREDRPGSYRARNAALEVATGEILAFTDADCLPEPAWISAAVRTLAGRDVVVAGPIVVFARDAARPHPAEAWELMHAFPQARYVAEGWAATANLVTTRRVFTQVGRFDESLFSGGDAAWGWRASAHGVPIIFEPAAAVRHPARESFQELHAKLARVQSGAYARGLAAGEAPPPWWREALRGWTPPVGSIARSWRDPRFATTRARLSYTAGALYVRYGSIPLRARLAARARRGA
jgi:glycosyltransferase involved in cell wall biosynthesis